MAIAVSAIATAIEVGTVAAALSAVATTGLVLTGVGLATGSQKLTKIGGTMGLVGGLGGLINGAIAGTAAGAAGAAEGAAAAAGEAGADSLVMGAGDALSGTAAGNAATTMTNAIGSANATAGGVTGGFNLTGANFGVDTSLMPGVSEALPGTTTDFAAAAKAAAPSLGPAAGQTLDDYIAGLGPKDLATPASGSFMENLKGEWDKLSPLTKAELLKSGLAIPGAVQAQKNNEKALDLQQQRINQTSHGSEVPAFGIIQRAQKGGV